MSEPIRARLLPLQIAKILANQMWIESGKQMEIEGKGAVYLVVAVSDGLRQRVVARNGILVQRIHEAGKMVAIFVC